MKQISVVAVDLDGTLMNDRKELSDGNRQAIEEAIRAGAVVVPTTGRPYSGFPPVLRTIEGLAYTITANGAAIYRLSDNACIYERAMPKTVTGPLCAFLDTLDVVIGCFIDGQGYMDRRSCAMVPDLRMPKPVQEYVYTSRQVVPDLGPFLAEDPRPTQKITVSFRPETMAAERQKILAYLEAWPDLNAVSGGENSMEISAADAAKGLALNWLAAFLGRTGTMACGDTENDLDMIRRADLGVAMANSEQILLDAADAVTDDNNHDGVAKAIRKYVLGEAEA